MAETLAITMPVVSHQELGNVNTSSDPSIEVLALSPEDAVFFQSLGEEALLQMGPTPVEGGEQKAGENGQVLENEDGGSEGDD